MVPNDLPPDDTAAPAAAPTGDDAPAGAAAPPTGQAPAAEAEGQGREEGGGTPTDDKRTPWEKRLDEVLAADDLTTLAKPTKLTTETAAGPEKLPAGWTRDASGKLKNDKGQYATLPSDAPAGRDPAAGADGAPAAPGSRFKLTFPGRGPTDAPDELELDEAALAAAGITPDRVQKLLEANNRLNAGYARREALTADRANLEEGQRFLDSIVSQLQNPKTSADFVLERLPPAVHQELAQRLLSTLPEEAFDAVLNTAMKWDRTPTERRTAAVEEENRRLKAAQQRRDASANDKAGMDEATALVTPIADLIPHDWNPQRQQFALNGAVQALMGYADKHNLDRLDPSKVVEILDGIGVLEALGLPKPGGAPSPKPTTPAGVPTPAEVKKAQKVGDELRVRAESRRSAAAVATGGNGSVTTPARPPRGAHKTLEERLQWVLGQ